MNMEIQEMFKKIENPIQKSFDLFKETERLQKRYERELQHLREQVPFDHYREACIRATEKFKKNLKQLLQKHGREDLYNQITSFLSGKISEMVKSIEPSSAS